MRADFSQPTPDLRTPPLPEVTFTVRGIRLVNREWSLRSACFPITITTSPSDPKLSSVEAEIMLREDAVGLYHHDSRTYIPIKQIYEHSSYLSGSEEELRSRSPSPTNRKRKPSSDLTNTFYTPEDDTNGTPINQKRRLSKDGTPVSPSTTPRGEVIWDVVYRRPGSPGAKNQRDSVGSFFEDDDDEEEEEGSKWADIKRCASILWGGTYVYLSIKRPLVYIDDLQKGIYSTDWSERGRRKMSEWFGKGQ
ncbi:hypothetical protein H072_369 [Dactylellina haptotyla CBS 200.50]|uniref:Uncharacterized protein n=1 Tax=Dactylellina haptotyla (strain CBS 200.50) TaxID=1284197 RepID=S8ARY2_DACHA|nr:hypothetical protein H072_369 [Dactylellina haptotyla CBS 200.50]